MWRDVSVSAAATVSASDDARYQAVSALGELNGVALQCKISRSGAADEGGGGGSRPKERSFGLAFDQATNDSFLPLSEAVSAVRHMSLERQVGHQIDRMAEAFAAR